MTLNLKSALNENDSIRLNQDADTWEQAVYQCIDPLIKSGAVEKKYYDAIIASTEKYGPYYILMPGMAMPHARPENGVKKNAFSLITLKKPVTFSDGKTVSVLVGLAAMSSDIHTGLAIPQIVAVFELDNIIKKMTDAKTKQDILSLIDQANISKYTQTKGE